jgi:Asp-tRNA(Asn)/Glu-tRNA(Gln) amidotransferase B subunit
MVEDLREFLSFVVEKKLQDHHSKMIMHRMLYFSEKMPDIRATFKVDSFDESELVEFAKEVISEHQNVVADYK